MHFRRELLQDGCSRRSILWGALKCSCLLALSVAVCILSAGNSSQSAPFDGPAANIGSLWLCIQNNLCVLLLSPVSVSDSRVKLKLLQLKCEAHLKSCCAFMYDMGERRIFKNLYILGCATSSQKPEIKINSLRICME